MLNTLDLKDSPVTLEQPGHGFAQATMAAAVAVRKALADLVSALPGDICRAREMQYALNLDYKLCWRVFHVIRAADAMGAANQIPKPPSIRLLLDAAARRGVRSEILEALRRAAEEFDRVVRVHAGSRVSFDAMVTGVSAADGSNQIDLFERRNAFRANAHIWGSQVDTFVSAAIVRMSKDGQGTDGCSITARLGLKRFRPGARAIAYRSAFKQEIGSALSSERALDLESQKRYGASLLPQFCTQPLPQFQKALAGDGRVSYELADEAVGRQSEVNLVFGSVITDLPFQMDAGVKGGGGRLFQAGVNFYTPTARVMSDLVIHRPSLGKVMPELLVFSVEPGHESPAVARAAQQLPVRAEVVAVRGGIEAAQIPEMSRYGEILRYACEAMEWNPAEFDIYRVVMDYPVLHSVVRSQFSV